MFTQLTNMLRIAQLLRIFYIFFYCMCHATGISDSSVVCRVLMSPFSSSSACFIPQDDQLLALWKNKKQTKTPPPLPSLSQRLHTVLVHCAENGSSPSYIPDMVEPYTPPLHSASANQLATPSLRVRARSPLPTHTCLLP